MILPFKNFPIVRNIVKVVNLHFSEMHHVRWILDKLYESTQAGLSRSDIIAGQIEPALARADSFERAVASLLLNDAAALNAASESLVSLDRLAKHSLEVQGQLSGDLRNIEGELQRSVRSIADLSEQTARFEQTARLGESLAGETARLSESLTGQTARLGESLTGQIARLDEHLVEQTAHLGESLAEQTRQTARSGESLAGETARLGANLAGLSDSQERIAERLHSMQGESAGHIATLREGLVKELSAKFNQDFSELKDQLRILMERSEEASPIRVPSEGDDVQEPEIELTAHLFPYLPNQNAVDVGANVGNFSARLLESGFNVVAFEPYEPAFKALNDNLGTNPNFQAFRFGLGSEDSTRELHVASDTSGRDSFPDPTLYNSFVDHSLMKGLEFTHRVPVEVRSLDSLQRSGVLPAKIAFLKVDTEGFDLEVLRGMGSGDYSVVMTEFWDGQHPFGRSGAGHSEDLIAAMRNRGYVWYIVIYHLDNNATISFYCNRARSVAGSWGNVVFFRENELFVHARRWCEAMLRPTFFG